MLFKGAVMAIKLTFAKRREDYVDNLSYWDICYWENRADLFDPNEDVVKSLNKNTKKELATLTNFAKLKNFMPEQEIWLHKELAKNSLKDYITLLDELNKSTYEDSFKCLLLKEYLDNTYTINGINGKITYEKHSRVLDDIDRGVMVLNADTIKYIYFNAKDYTSFKSLYFDSQTQIKKEIIKQQIALYAGKTNKKSFDVDNMLLNLPDSLTKGESGVWLKFAGATEDKKNHKQNANNLAVLVNSTNSCLVRTALEYLSEGPIYVYVDDNYIPQIRVVCYDSSIQEVRGLAGGQQIMPKYLDIAIDFLDKNDNVENANYFKDFVKADKQALGYIRAYKKGELSDSELEKAKKCLEFIDVQSIEGDNEYAKTLSSLIKEQEDMPEL